MNKLNYFNRICMFGIPILRVISLYIKIIQLKNNKITMRKYPEILNELKKECMA